MRHITSLPLAALIGALPAAVLAGEDDRNVSLTGSIQTEWLAPETDATIGANKNDYNANFIGNTYIGLNLESKYVTAGLRFETMENPLPGFENQYDKEPFAGTGLPYFQVTGRYKWAELTAGTFYEQFGSGFILRAYEERTLGVDNSLLGGRLVLRPGKGLQIKALGGVQRYHFSWTDSYLLGADVEMNLDQWISGLGDNGHYLTLGVSGISKHEGDNLLDGGYWDTPYEDENGDTWRQKYLLQTPKNVGAMDVRLQYQKGGTNILAEYAWKGNDPNGMNGYTYGKGQVAMLSATYSRTGFSAILQAKRSENMAFRSRRDLDGKTTSCYINHQPAFAFQHTYSLASLYPYGTQMDGEWAFQGEVSYRFKRHTAMGGKYGTLLKLNASHIRGLDYKSTPTNQFGTTVGTDGASTSFFGMTDDVYYQDINLTMEKKLSKTWKLTAMYMNQQYNQAVIEGHGVNGDIVKSNIGVVEAKWQGPSKWAVRAEAQYLQTKQDQGDWTFGLVEVSLQPGWMFTVSDQWNNGETDTHYVNGNVVYTFHAHRLQMGYGRKRKGLDCSGGVCRTVPASRGFSVSYNYNF
jgi:hypothetical protein